MSVNVTSLSVNGAFAESVFITLRDVNNYRVGTGDNYDATEEQFLRVVEACDDGATVWVRPRMATAFEAFCRNLLGGVFPYVRDAETLTTAVLREVA